MTTQQLLTTTWDWTPGLLLSTALLVIAYLLLVHRLTRQSLLFFAGVLLLVLTLASPLSLLGQQYLFSAHMAQHMIILLIVPPLLLAGIPARVFQGFFRGQLNWRLSPLLAWLLGVGIMWFWHAPGVFNATVSQSGIAVCGIGTTTLTASLHDLQNASLLVAGLLFIWPIFSPLPEQRLPALSGMAYLFTACVGCSLLGLSITFSSTLLYTNYASTIDLTGAGYLIRQQWGLTPEADQQIGGLLMWVPGCFLYVTAALYLLTRWFDEEEQDFASIAHESKTLEYQ